MNNIQKKLLIRRIFRKIYNQFLGLEFDFAFDRGISLFGINIRKSKSKFAERSQKVLNYCLTENFKSVLDVGSGGGWHAKEFAKNGSKVTCIDYGKSIYAKSYKTEESINLIIADFNNWITNEKYELIWASHIFEHQENVGKFINKLIKLCSKNGKIAITVPYPHRHIWGGHLSIWTPGLLIYNIVIQGIDMSNAKLLYGYKEFSVIFSPNFKDLPKDLSFDKGDVQKLKKFFPSKFSENSDSWF